MIKQYSGAKSLESSSTITLHQVFNIKASSSSLQRNFSGQGNQIIQENEFALILNIFMVCVSVEMMPLSLMSCLKSIQSTDNKLIISVISSLEIPNSHSFQSLKINKVRYQLFQKSTKKQRFLFRFYFLAVSKIKRE